jgi:hypothetical protein
MKGGGGSGLAVVVAVAELIGVGKCFLQRHGLEFGWSSRW